MNWKAVSVAIFTCGVIFATGARLIANARAGENNIDIIQPLVNPCPYTYARESGKLAVLRIDDIQAFAWRDISERMTRDALARHIKPVLGVIPLNLKDDARMYKYLRSVRCEVEMALHGWDNKVSDEGVAEFERLSEEEAEEKISRGKEVLEWLAREDIVTFIPPNNIYSEGTGRALQKAGFKYVTSEGAAEFDYHATTYNFSASRLVPTDEVVDACKRRFEAGEICVVMMHPQDFASGDKLDEAKYAVYLSVLDAMAREGTSFVRFKDLD